MVIKLNYISEFSERQNLGGWDGINAGLAYELGLKCALHYVGPIYPRPDRTTKLLSKARRLIGLRGAFSSYSRRRLAAYAREATRQAFQGADADFFHGATPWVACSPSRKYFSYIDACFHTFLFRYQNPDLWLKQDLERIYNMEKTWLEKAERVFVTSNWAAKEARRAYGLDGRNLQVVGVGAAINAPAQDSYKGAKRFLAVMTDFTRKGGPICVEAFRQVRAQHSDATLVFVGQAPPPELLVSPGVEYAGFLNKSIIDESARLTELFSTAFALLLPSKAETSPIIIAEAGQFGCPAIAPKRFGIPEMVIQWKTGLLLDGDATVTNVANAMLELCHAPEEYLRLRMTTRNHFCEKFTWKSVVETIQGSISSCVLATRHSVQSVKAAAA